MELGRILSELAIEALNRHFSTLVKPVEKSQDEWDEMLEKSRREDSLSVYVKGSDGEELVAASIADLKVEHLPRSLHTIIFNSSFLFSSRYQVNLQNQFMLTLDFTEAPNFSEYDPLQAPTPNVSKWEVQGPDGTWVAGAFERILTFFRQRRSRLDWIHSTRTFSFVYWMLVFPSSLIITLSLDEHYISSIFKSPVLRGATDIYVFLMVIYLIRWLLSLFRWLFPIIQLKNTPASTVKRIVASILIAIILGVVGDAIYDIIKWNLSPTTD